MTTPKEALVALEELLLTATQNAADRDAHAHAGRNYETIRSFLTGLDQGAGQQPVAWRYRSPFWPDGEWQIQKTQPYEPAFGPPWSIEPLFTQPIEGVRKPAYPVIAEAGYNHEASPQTGWSATHRHKKRGTLYRVIGQAQVQAALQIRDDETVCVYQGEDGKLWVRPVDEFEDGRFEPIPTPPANGAEE